MEALLQSAMGKIEAVRAFQAGDDPGPVVNLERSQQKAWRYRKPTPRIDTGNPTWISYSGMPMNWDKTMQERAEGIFRDRSLIANGR